MSLARVLNYLFEPHAVLGFYFLAFFLCGINVTMYYIYLPLYLPLIKLGSLELLGLVFLMTSLGNLLGQLFFGYICLKKDRFKLFLILPFLAFLLIYLALYLQMPLKEGLPFLLVFSFFTSSLMSTAKTLITLLFPDRKTDLIGKLMAWDSIGVAVSSVTVGIWLESQKSSLEAYTDLFLLLVLMNILACIFLILFFPSKQADLNWNQLPPQKIVTFIKLLKMPELRILFAYVLIVSTSSIFYFFYFGRYFKEILGGSETLVGLSMTLATLTGAIAYPIYGWAVTRYGCFLAFVYCIVCYLACFTSLGLTNSHWVYVAWYSMPFYPMVTIAANTVISHLTTEGDRGIGFGLLDGIFTLTVIFAPLIGYIAFQFLPLQYLSWIAIAILSLGIPLLPWLYRIQKRMLTPIQAHSESRPEGV